MNFQAIMWMARPTSFPVWAWNHCGKATTRSLNHIYAPKFYYERVLTFLREYNPPKIRFHPDPQYILALWRSIYRLGIRGVERVQYWRLFFWTLFRRPRLFPLAITLAIMGFHFRQVTELHVG